jgi:hypothetical protein
MAIGMPPPVSRSGYGYDNNNSVHSELKNAGDRANTAMDYAGQTGNPEDNLKASQDQNKYQEMMDREKKKEDVRHQTIQKIWQ